MAIPFLSSFSHGQPPLAPSSNLNKIIQKVMMNEEDKYIINEASVLRIEAKKLLEDAQKMTYEWAELKNLELAVSHFDDLKKKTEKKKIKTECRILSMQSEALETYELYNDLLYAFYQKQYKNIFPDVDVVTIAEGNRLMKEAEVLWISAKNMRDLAYATGVSRKMIEQMIKAQKQEEEAILMQEQSLALLLAFTPSEGQHIPYALLDMPKGVTPASENNPVLLAEANTITSVTDVNNKGITKSTDVSFSEPCKEEVKAIVCYKIQIGAFLGKANEAAFKGINPISTERSETGFTRYLAGDFHSYEVAYHALEILRNTGFSDAFIVVYADNLRMGPVTEKYQEAATAKK